MSGNDISYEIIISYDFAGAFFEKTFGFSTKEQCVSFLEAELTKDSAKVSKILEYRSVYKHGNMLPEFDGYNDFFEEKMYFENHKQEKPITIKRKHYKDNFTKEFDLYCFTYKILDRRLEFLDTEFPLDYYKELHVSFDLKDGSKENIMKALYEHSRIKSIFELELFEYRVCKLSEFNL